MKFPNLSGVPVDARDAYVALRGDWLRARQLRLTAEDVYVLDEIASAKVAEGWASFVALTELAPERLPEGQALLRQQFEILRARVREIIDRHAEAELANLSAQVTALMDVTGNTASNLRLPADRVEPEAKA